MFTFAVGSAAHGAVVLDNVTTSPTTGGTVGLTIGSAFLTGNTALSLSNVVFIQAYSTGGVYGTDSYVSGETFSVNARNADGTVGATLFSNFTLYDGGSSGAGAFETEADANTAFTLQANTGYYFSVTAPSTTTWAFASDKSANTSNGASFPTTGSVAYKTTGGAPVYFSAAVNPQSIYVVANPLAVPEPSTYCLMAVAGLALVVGRKRVGRLA